MRDLKWYIPAGLLLIIIAVYLWPVPHPSFEKLYAKVPAEKSASLKAFRETVPLQHYTVDGVDWEYISTGQGNQAIVFLHGMTGSYDIWWQQIQSLKKNYRIVSVTYPAVGSLEELDNGLIAILDHEKINRFNVVGTSLGGYFAQYLVRKHPERILKAVFANTFPPNDLIEQKNGQTGTMVPFLPEWLVMNILRGSFSSSIYPASGNDELTLAFLNEIGYGRMTRIQVYDRYRCVVEKFKPPVGTGIPILIIQASNDPLVEPALREALVNTYPHALVVTVKNGHFPYLSKPDFYTQQLRGFFSQ